ncbi:MAG: AmmeMemoRadiSam system protein A [Planctomycetes bacterium]|nr:AmmeMemoRadiSam system protein A [Planctomycetota bacterium]
MQGGAKGIRVKYDTSGELTNKWTNSVTYQSFVFTRHPGTLGRDAQDTLLKLARKTVTGQVTGKPREEVDPESLPEQARQDGACFVTLENHGELRGCIGNMVATGPLYDAVTRNGVSACQDGRFRHNPVTARELDDLNIEISYLTPMQRVKDISEIVVGRHGIQMVQGDRRGVLLPQVAYERGWTREEFLEQTCKKAGLPTDAWKQPDTEIYSFEAEVFSEPEPNRGQRDR